MTEQRVALITGASQGLGFSLARALAERGWELVIDGRDPDRLAGAAAFLEALGATVHPVVGDVADGAHRLQLASEVAAAGRLDALINNASELGPSPLPGLRSYDLAALARVYEVNVIAPLALTQLLVDELVLNRGCVVNITSDAAIEGYPGWGGYGSSKAALEQLSHVLSVEEAGLRVYWVDPGDLRTQMHQDAFPGEDISDRPLPEVAVPGLLALLDGQLPSGRYRAQSLTAVGVAEPVR
jgi:NAD(P)-dependent dehydrogenase (short-subunit alcohol dehydrogenase family)